MFLRGAESTDNATCLAHSNTSIFTAATNESCVGPDGEQLSAEHGEENCTLTGSAYVPFIAAKCIGADGVATSVGSAMADGEYVECPFATGNTYAAAFCVGALNAAMNRSCEACTGDALCRNGTGFGRVWRPARCERLTPFDQSICEAPNEDTQQPNCAAEVAADPTGETLNCSAMHPSGRWRACNGTCVPRRAAAAFVNSSCVTPSGGLVEVDGAVACEIESTGNVWAAGGTPNCTSVIGGAPVLALDQAACVTRATGNVWHPATCTGDTGSRAACEVSTLSCFWLIYSAIFCYRLGVSFFMIAQH